MRLEKQSPFAPGREFPAPPAPAPGGRASVGTVVGLLVAITLHALCLWGAVAVLRAAEVVAWTFTWWQYGALAGLYLLWRALGQVMWARPRP